MSARVIRVSVYSAALWIAMAGLATALEGWSRSVEDGTVFFTCRSSDCGYGAQISCRVVGGNAITSMEQFETRIRSQADALKAAGRSFEAGRTYRSIRGKRVLYEATYLVQAPGGRAVQRFRSAYLVGPTETFSIVGSSADTDTTKRNLHHFVSELIRRDSSAFVDECLP